jgi:hypothetical protein
LSAWVVHDRPAVAVVILLGSRLLLAGCSAAATSATDDDDIKRILRPSAPIIEDTLVPNGDVVVYTATLRTRPDSEFKKRYLAELALRGLALFPSTSSAYRPAAGIRGYKVKILQEVKPHPYTVRYKVAYVGADKPTAADYPFPIDVAGHKLVFRLGPGIISPWKTHVVVPDRSVAALPFGVALPPDSIVIGVDDKRTASNHEPASVIIDFLAPAPPSEVLGFFRRDLRGGGSANTDTPQAFGVTISAPPKWAPRGLTHVLVSSQPYLFTDAIGVAVPIAAFASGNKDTDVDEARYLPALPHLPKNIFRYLLIAHFNMQAG